MRHLPAGGGHVSARQRDTRGFSSLSSQLSLGRDVVVLGAWSRAVLLTHLGSCDVRAWIFGDGL